MPTEPSGDRIHSTANRLFLRISGRWFHAYSIVVHTGRTSGRVYRNPVSAYPLGDGFVIPVLYGLDSQWVRNVLATGQLTVRTKGRDHALERAALVSASEALPAFPRPLRAYYGSRGISDFVHRA
jgi:deazaflavin-dependent oxidoreductase (nitroreductase family)